MTHRHRKPLRSRRARRRAAAAQPTARGLLPLGALAAGFGLMHAQALAQVAPPSAAAVPPPAAASAPDGRSTTMPAITVKARPEADATSLRATTTNVGRGTQEQRDIPQSVTVVTERLMEDRQVDTLNQALRLMGGISFLAGEGGEQDVRLRGFSMSNDLYVDTIHDPGFYDRDTFNFDRIELLRGSASMLFGRGSTGGVVNQVSKQPFLDNANVVSVTGGSYGFLRVLGDFNVQTGDSSALRLNLMRNTADNNGNFIDKEGAALSYRFGIGSSDEFYASIFYLNNDNGINYGLPWVRVSSTQPSSNPSVLIPGLNPNDVYYGAPSDYNAGGTTYGTLGWQHRFSGGGELRAALRYGSYDRDQRASTIRFCQNNAANANPDCPSTPQGLDTISAVTILTRGTNNKVQDMRTTYALLDYTDTFDWFGLNHEVLAGIDLAYEDFAGYAMVLPAGVVLNKNSPRTTLGTPDNSLGWVDEGLRRKLQQSSFDARGRHLRAGPDPGGRVLEAARRPALRLLPRRLPELPDRRRRQRADRHRHRAPAPLRRAVERAPRAAVPAHAELELLLLVRHLVQHLGRHLRLRPAGLEHAARVQPQPRAGHLPDAVRQPAEPARVGLQHHQVPRAQPRLARGHADR